MSEFPPPPAAPHMPPPWPPVGPPPKKRQWPVLAFLTVGLLITLAVAIVGWFRPVAPEPPTVPAYSAQQTADAKTKVCAAFRQADAALRAASARDKGQDYATQLATAVNVRQAFIAGSQYLSNTLHEQPATPADIASTVRDLANAYQLVAMDLLSDAPESEKTPIVRSGDDASSKLEDLCK